MKMVSIALHVKKEELKEKDKFEFKMKVIEVWRKRLDKDNRRC